MAQLELLWAAAALMLLGAAVSLCVKCQLSATKREKQPSERTNQLEGQQTFEVIRFHSSTTRRLEQIKEPENLSIARKTTKELSASWHAGYGSGTECRYQNFLTEDYLQEDAAYVEPIALDYYNCASFFTPPNEKEEDSHSYQNVVIEVSHSSDSDDAVDYENSTAIHVWELQQAEALQTESPDDEPDYVNTAPASGSATLSKQSTRMWSGRQQIQLSLRDASPLPTDMRSSPQPDTSLCTDAVGHGSPSLRNLSQRKV